MRGLTDRRLELVHLRALMASLKRFGASHTKKLKHLSTIKPPIREQKVWTAFRSEIMSEIGQDGRAKIHLS